MPTTKQMLERAEQYERIAQALRLAAGEMNGHALSQAQQKGPAIIEAAIQTRREQRGDTNLGPATLDDKRRLRQAIIEEQLDNGPKKISELQVALAEGGLTVSKSRITQLVKELGAKLRGSGAKAIWRLKPNATPETPKRRPPSDEKRAQQTIDKGRIVAEILQAAGGKLTSKELAAAARERGITGLTGIYAYVQRGLIKKHGNEKGQYSYSFKALPPAEETAAAS